MDDEKKRALRKCHPAISEGILVAHILPDLRSDLTHAEYDSVASRKSNSEQVDMLISILLTKGNGHFDRFCFVLKKHEYEDIEDQLSREAGEYSFRAHQATVNG